MSMPVPAGYKKTEIGVIPKDWCVKPLRHIGDPVRGGSPRPAGDPRFFNGTYIPWLTVAALTNIPASQLTVRETATCLTEEGSLYSRTLLPGTLVIANSGATLGVAKILGVKCCANDGIAAILNISTDVSSKYLAYFLNTKTTYLRAVVATGNGQPNLNTHLIGRFNVPLPPTRMEQEAIAEVLNDADSLIESLQRLLTKKRHVKQGAMRELLTGRSRLPGFMEDWKVARLDELGTWKGGMTPSMQNLSYWHMGTVPWISSGDVKSVLLNTTGSAVTDAAIAHGTTILVPAQSIIIVTRSGILRKYLPVAMNMIPMAINQDIKALIPNGQVIPSYLLHTLIGHGDQILARCMKAGTTVESIEFPWMKAFTVPLPPLAEQVAIAAALSDMDAEIADLESQLTKTRAIKQGMLNELLTGKIRLK